MLAEFTTKKQKLYEAAPNKPEIIVVHHACANTIGQLINAYHDRGVSAHYAIDRDGIVYQTVLDNKMAYHAGVSFWRGKSSINLYSIGIEQINTGDDVNNNWGVELPKKVADGVEWEPYTEVQLEAIAKLINMLKVQYHIDSWNIIGHSDCTPGRKVDPGPLFPWRELYDKYDIGFMPINDTTLTLELAQTLTTQDYIMLLLAIGYPINSLEAYVENITELTEKQKQGIRSMSKRDNSETIQAFQYHYLQNKFIQNQDYRSGTLDNDTKLMILQCVKAIVIKVELDNYSIKILQHAYITNLSNEAKQLIDSWLSINNKAEL
jgi:N-acetylmuramoyl-L-alanine amidase